MKNRILPVILVILLGIGACTYMIIQGVGHLTGDGIRLLAPSSSRQEFLEGSYTVFHEYKSSMDGKIFRSTGNDLTGFELIIMDPYGERVEIGPSRGNFTYEINGRAGASIFTFDILESAEYHIIMESDSEVVINISNMDVFKFIKYLFAGLGLLGVSAVIVIAILVKRPKKRYDTDYDYYED